MESSLTITPISFAVLLGVGSFFLVACSGTDQTLITRSSNFALLPDSTSQTSATDAESIPTGGPKVPACGIIELEDLEIIAGQEFQPGQYLIHSFGLRCNDVIGEAGIFNQFLGMTGDEPLPEPWIFLEGALGAPKFAAGPGIGFRIQRIGD